TRKPANRSTVPRRTYSNSRRAGRPGAAGWSGAVGVRTPMPGLSSTQNSGPSVGGLSSSSMTATAFSAKSGSRSFIQASKAVQAQVVALQDDADRALARRAQAQLGVGPDEGGQVLDRPVGLPRPGRVHLGRFLAGQHEQPRLDGGAVAARRRAGGPGRPPRPPPAGGAGGAPPHRPPPPDPRAGGAP